ASSLAARALGERALLLRILGHRHPLRIGLRHQLDAPGGLPRGTQASGGLDRASLARPRALFRLRDIVGRLHAGAVSLVLDGLRGFLLPPVARAIYSAAPQHHHNVAAVARLPLFLLP